MLLAVGFLRDINQDNKFGSRDRNLDCEYSV